MTLRFLISALITTALFAQVRGGFGRLEGANGNSSRSSTPPTAAQLAAGQLQTVARFLGLDSAQTSALTEDTTLVTELASEEATLQSNATTLQTDYSALATELIQTPLSVPSLTAIETLINADVQARVTAAGQIIAALQALSGSLALSSQQTAKLPTLVSVLVGGGGPVSMEVAHRTLGS